MRRRGRRLPPFIPESLTLELRSRPARQRRALLPPHANQTVNAAQKREGGSQRGELSTAAILLNIKHPPHGTPSLAC